MPGSVWGLCLVVMLGVLVGREIKKKYLGIWLGAYLAQRWGSRRGITYDSQAGPLHILFCMVDHFEPISQNSTREQQRERMRIWLERYPQLAKKHRDSYGRAVQHTWFYPGEVYDAEYLDNLAELCRQGVGEIELHYHHGFDNPDTFSKKLRQSVAQFEKHGALVTQGVPPRYTYGFIHGNMALDNSRHDPSVCGVNAELTVLKETGCYADFSSPTAGCISQTRKINAIYYAVDDPQRPKSHNTGIDVQVGGGSSGDLMIIQGPLALDWHERKWGILPRVENGEIQSSNPPAPHRITNWVRQHIHVKGRPEWVIVKVSCHGAEDRNVDVMLGAAADKMYTHLEAQYRDRNGFKLHYLNARELFNIIKAAEAGMTGDPDRYRDYAIAPYKTHDEEIKPDLRGNIQSQGPSYD